MRPELDFMLKITKNINEIKRIYEPPMKDYLFMGIRMELFEKIPYNHTCHRHDEPRAILENILVDDGVKQRDNIFELFRKICLEISSNKLPKNDFKTSYVNWIRDPPENTDIRRVQSSLNSIKTEHSELSAQFSNRTVEVKQMITKIDTDIGKANLLMKKILAAVNIDQVSSTIIRLIEITDRVSSRRDDLISKLMNVE